MNRRKFVRAAGVSAIGSAVLAAPAIAQSQPVLKWRLTSSFPKNSRHHLRRRRNVLADRFRGHRRQFPHPGLSPQRDRAWSPGCRRRHQWLGRNVPDLLLLLWRQGPDLCFWHRRALRHQCRQQNAWLYFGGGQELINAFYEKYNIYSLRRQYRRPDGRLVPQRDQVGRRSQRPQDAHRRVRRPGDLEARRIAAADRRRRNLSRRSRRAPSMPPNGSAPMTMTSSASTRWRPIIIIPAGGKAARPSTSSSISRNGTRCPKSYQAHLTSAAAALPMSRCWRAMTRTIRRRSRTWSPVARGCGPSRPTSWKPASRPRTSSMPRSARKCRVQEDA